jgi:hypothetical protein
MAAKKVIGGILKSSRPYSRGEVATALAALDKKVREAIPRIGVSSGDVTLSRIEQKRLAHLMRIFAIDLPDYQYHRRNTKSEEYLLQTQGETYRLGLSMEAGETVVNRNLPVRVRTQTGQSDTTRSEVASESEANRRSGHKVNVVDNLSMGGLENIQHLRDKPDFSFVEGDILDESLMESLILRKLKTEADEIYHLAAVVGIRSLIEHGIKAFKTNVHPVR